MLTTSNFFARMALVFKTTPLLLFALTILMSGCKRSGNAESFPVELAQKALAESFLVKYELGEVTDVKLIKTEMPGHVFQISGTKQNAKMTYIPVTPSGPQGSLFLDDGRQLPLFTDFLEESYREDYEREQGR